VRLSRKLRIYLAAGPTAAPERVKKADVLTRLERGVWINVFGLGSTLLGLQVSVCSAPDITFAVEGSHFEVLPGCMLLHVRWHHSRHSLRVCCTMSWQLPVRRDS